MNTDDMNNHGSLANVPIRVTVKAYNSQHGHSVARTQSYWGEFSRLKFDISGKKKKEDRKIGDDTKKESEKATARRRKKKKEKKKEKM